MRGYPKDIDRFLISLLLLSSATAFANCQCNAKRDPHFPKLTVSSIPTPLSPATAARTTANEMTEAAPSKPSLQPAASLEASFEPFIPTAGEAADAVLSEPIISSTTASGAPIDPVPSISDKATDVSQPGRIMPPAA